MARYTGPKAKIGRKFSEPILGKPGVVSRKSYGPGQHGKNKRRKKSDYAIQLAEKQKAKYIYGVLERQFEKTFHEAARRQGPTGENLLQLLESRLDNVVYRMGIAPSRRAARQLVLHKHVVVNGEVVNIPSFTAKPGDIIGVRERSKSLETISKSLSSRQTGKYSWIEWDQKLMTGRFLNMPAKEVIPENIHVQLIVELYSK